MEESGRAMGKRHISRTLKGKVLNSCVTPAYLYSLETMAMTDKQQERLQHCDNNWARRTAGVKRIKKQIMEKLSEEVGVSLMRKLVRSQLKWAGHVERMEGNDRQREWMHLEWRVEGDEEDQDGDRRTA